MAFTDVFDFPGDGFFPDGRVYQHSFGSELFEKGKREVYVKEALSALQGEYDFFISILWGYTQKGVKVMDLAYFPPGSTKDWKSNLEPQNMVFLNGVWRVVPKVTCEEGFILLGEEFRNRRKTGSLEEFALKPVKLDALNSMLKFSEVNPSLIDRHMTP